MDYPSLIKWLLQGDISIQYQVYRDLLSTDKNDLQNKISLQGWGKKFLSKQHPDGHWGKRFYEPKWISSHYTLLDLRNLNIAPDHPQIKNSIDQVVQKNKAPDGGVNPIGTKQLSDVCINGMFLNYASYFHTAENDLKSIVDFLLNQKMPDGGFNCRCNRSGAKHSSLHSTISVLEGISQYQHTGYQYRLPELDVVKRSGIAFILLHRLYLSDRTDQIIHKDFLKFHYPYRWKYDILRALDYFQFEGLTWDNRMQDALDILFKKRRKDNTWNLNAGYPGKVHFQMEKAGKPSRWNTLRALRVLKHFDKLNV